MSVFSEAVKKKNAKKNKNSFQGKGPLAPGADQAKGSQTGMAKANQQDSMMVGTGPTMDKQNKGPRGLAKYQNEKGAINQKSVAQMKADGFKDKKVDRLLRRQEAKGGKLGERAAERIREDMGEGAKIRDFDAGRVLTKRDIKYMQAQGFADKKIQKFAANHEGKVGKAASNWMQRQQAKAAKPTGGTGDPGSNGGAGEGQPAPTNPSQQLESNIGNVDGTQNQGGIDNVNVKGKNNAVGTGAVGGKDNQGGIGNTNVKDTGDIKQTTDIKNTMDQNVRQDNDINQTVGDGSNVVNNVDNSVRSYGGDNRSMVINTGNTGAQGGAGSSLTGALDGAATAATLGGFYDVDDSPAAQAKFMDVHNTLNIDQQKRFPDATQFADQAIAKADQRAEMDANRLDKRIMARTRANEAQGRLMYNDLFGDPSQPTADWQRPETPDAPEEPDWDDMYGNMTDF